MDCKADVGILGAIDVPEMFLAIFFGDETDEVLPSGHCSIDRGISGIDLTVVGGREGYRSCE